MWSRTSRSRRSLPESHEQERDHGGHPRTISHHVVSHIATAPPTDAHHLQRYRRSGYMRPACRSLVLYDGHRPIIPSAPAAPAWVHPGGALATGSTPAAPAGTRRVLDAGRDADPAGGRTEYLIAGTVPGAAAASATLGSSNRTHFCSSAESPTRNSWRVFL